MTHFHLLIIVGWIELVIQFRFIDRKWRISRCRTWGCPLGACYHRPSPSRWRWSLRLWWPRNVMWNQKKPCPKWMLHWMGQWVNGGCARDVKLYGNLTCGTWLYCTSDCTLMYLAHFQRKPNDEFFCFCVCLTPSRRSKTEFGSKFETCKKGPQHLVIVVLTILLVLCTFTTHTQSLRKWGATPDIMKMSIRWGYKGYM